VNDCQVRQVSFGKQFYSSKRNSEQGVVWIMRCTVDDCIDAVFMWNGCVNVERMSMRRWGMLQMEHFLCAMHRQRCRTVTRWRWG